MRRLIAIAALALALAWGGASARATAYQQYGLETATNLPTTWATNTTSNTVCFIKLNAGKGLGLQFLFMGATNVTYTISPSVDGITPLTNISWTITSTNALAFTTGTNASGATNNPYTGASNYITAGTNWSAAQLAGYNALCVTTIGCVGNIPLTNVGMIYNLPYF